MSKKTKIILIIIGVALIVVFLYSYFMGNGVTIDKLKAVVGTKAVNYSDPTEATTVIMAGAEEIISNPLLLKQAKAFADSTGIDIETVIVTSSINQAENNGYLIKQ